MKRTAIVLTLMFSISILSGCLGGNSSGENESVVTDLQAQIDNLTVGNQQHEDDINSLEDLLASSSSLVSEIESSLTEANETIGSLTETVMQKESQISNLSDLYERLMEEFENSTAQNSSYISSLESQIQNISQMMEILEDERDEALDQISQKEVEIAQLTDSLDTAEQRIELLISHLYYSVAGCPESNPGNKLSIGFDDGSSGGIQGDGILSGGEIVSTIGECPGNSGLVKDINTVSTHTSWEKAMVTMGGVLYFIADDGVHGDELWRSDGTMGGTNMVIDLNPTRQAIIGGSIVDENPGTNFGEIVAGDEKIFFSAAVGNDEIRELYVSDGSNSGTLKISETFDCEPQIFSNYPEFSYSGVNSISVMPASEVGFDTAYFSAFRCSYQNVVCSGEEPHISDGTESGTYQLADLFYGDTDLTTPGGGSITADLVGSQPSEFTRSGNSIYFSAKADMGAVLTDVGRELFVIDTSSPLGGVQLVKDINYGSADSSPSLFESMGGELFFTADDGISGMELWKSDGTNSGTMIVSNIAANGSSSWPGQKISVGDTLFFTANDGISGYELWKSNGTYSGTSLVKDIVAGSSDGGVINMVEFDDELYFIAYSMPPGTFGTQGTEVWRSNGSDSGTVRISGSLLTDTSTASNLTRVGDRLYYVDEEYGNGAGMELFSFTLEGGITLAVDTWPGSQSSDSRNLIALGEKVFFVGNDGLSGDELRYHWYNPGPIIA
ncbi:MAG: hypothetical protein DBX04_02005 [Candidatus Poseidoniales archaeon]|nr:MAG: hypothetical protein DBX04_02005 [Candidatus Poseidoniales archaeon]